jgi:hypothetical protein
MALAQQVEDSLKEAEASLRNALAFAARSERPMVCGSISKMIAEIETLMKYDAMIDKLENRKPGDNDIFGMFFKDE